MFEKVKSLFREKSTDPLSKTLYKYIKGVKVPNYGYQEAVTDIAWAVARTTGDYMRHFVCAKIFLDREYYRKNGFEKFMAPAFMASVDGVQQREKELILRADTLDEPQREALGLIFEKRLSALYWLNINFYHYYIREFGAIMSIAEELVRIENKKQEDIINDAITLLLGEGNKASDDFLEAARHREDSGVDAKEYAEVICDLVYEKHFVEKLFAQIRFLWDICYDYIGPETDKERHAMVLIQFLPMFSDECERYYGHPLLNKDLCICDPRTGEVYDNDLDFCFGWSDELILQFREKYPDLFQSSGYTYLENQMTVACAQIKAEFNMCDDKTIKKLFTRI